MVVETQDRNNLWRIDCETVMVDHDVDHKLISS